MKSCIKVLSIDLDKLNDEIDRLKSDLKSKTFYKKYHQTKVELDKLKKEMEELIDLKFNEILQDYR